MPPVTRSALLSVGWAAAGDPAALAEAAGSPVTAVGVPVVETSDGPVLAPGVPESFTVAGAGGPAGSTSHRSTSTASTIGTALDLDRAGQRGFAGKVGQTMNVVGPDAGAGPAVVFVGCGPLDAVNADSLRRAAAAFVRDAGESGAAVMIVPPALADPAGSHTRAAQAAAEGAVLAMYRFVSHKSEADSSRIERLVVAAVGLQEGQVAEGVRRGAAVADAVCLARDLVNEPPSSMTPTRLAEAAVEHMAGRPGLTVEVWDEARIADERLGGLLGVARGSAEPPRLLRASYEPADPVEVDGRVPHVVLVGKGITFDSGGLSLKTAEGMVTMKTDMSGAAAVVAVVSACGDVGVRARVTAIAPMTENMPGGRAIKPGDVLTTRSGRTIEVLNTDAEGRLVLADGLTLATELEPDAIIDLATLTGACVVALGMSIAGVIGSDDGLVDRVRAASGRAGEATWPLPLFDDYRSHIDSDVADMKNVGKGGQAGAISAALLLARFAEGTPWAHLDIAGPARSDEDAGVLTKGGTGFGVRTLLELLEDYGHSG